MGSKDEKIARLIVDIPKELKRQVQLHALYEETTIKNIVIKALEDWLTRRGPADITLAS